MASILKPLDYLWHAVSTFSDLSSINLLQQNQQSCKKKTEGGVWG